MIKAALIALAVVAVVSFLVLRGGVARSASAQAQPFEPDAHNDKIVLVRGWSETELRKIVDAFVRMYGLTSAFEITPTSRDKSVLRISFPDDLAPENFFFLVNYINYPRDFDLKKRNIGVVARATLTAAFKVPDASFVGKTAEVYVPTEDTEYDLVHVLVSDRSAYRYSFAKEEFEPITDKRMPSTIRGL